MRKPETNDGALPPVGVVDEELWWFFSVHDGKRFSPYFEELEARRDPEAPEPDPRKARRYWRIRARLVRLADHDAGVLMAAYAPRPWPEQLQRVLGRLTGVVVRLASAGSGWPEGRAAQDVHEVRVARQLDVALTTGGREVFAAYRTTARALLRRALVAYRSAREAALRAAWRRA